MALTFNLAAIPLKLVGFPVIAGLAAGTGALAAYITTPASMPVTNEPLAIVAALPATPLSTAPAVSTEMTPAKSIKKPSCEQQTWPYIDNRCIARKGDGPARSVRVVMASRDGDDGLASGTGPKLVTSDGVLRGPDVAPEMPKAKPVAPTLKRAVRRSEARQRRQSHDQFNRVYSVYSVPSADSTKPVIVVRPLRVNQYASDYSPRF
jgi:hypothetical protein